jgi:type II secretory ATPase GspE/PulE/Tfp pilus assembly ATPase PilB-like protein
MTSSRLVLDLDSDDANEKPVNRLCNLILAEGLLNGATRIRIAASDREQGTVEYEIGNVWRQVMKVPIQAHRPIMDRLKDMAGLYVGRLPNQLGHIRVDHRGKHHQLDLQLAFEPNGGETALVGIPSVSAT